MRGCAVQNYSVVSGLKGDGSTEALHKLVSRQLTDQRLASPVSRLLPGLAGSPGVRNA